jgi:vacuolar-type H+-ATPase subunit F/Vma7
MSKLRVIAVGEYPLIVGFALAGSSVIAAETREEAAARLASIVGADDVGLVVAEQAVVDALPDATRDSIAHRSLPIVLGIPAPDWSAEPRERENEILDLLQRAIGYRVRLQ